VAHREPHALSHEHPQRVVALAFDSEPLAHEALHQAWRLHEQHQLDVHDVVVVSAEHGRPRVVDKMDPTPLAAAVPSALLGALIGALIGGPLGFLIGGALAGATGALAARHANTGVPHRVVTQLVGLTKPGQAVLALLVDDDDSAERVRHLPGARVVYDH
jgi:uncharacterized membrane protein